MEGLGGGEGINFEMTVDQILAEFLIKIGL